MESEKLSRIRKYWFWLMTAFLLCFVVFSTVHVARVLRGEHGIGTYSYTLYILGLACIETAVILWRPLNRILIPVGTKVFCVVYFPLAALATTLPLIYIVGSYLHQVDVLRTPDDLCNEQDGFFRFEQFSPQHAFLSDYWKHSKHRKNIRNVSATREVDDFHFEGILPITAGNSDTLFRVFVHIGSERRIDGDMDESQVSRQGEKFYAEKHEAFSKDSLEQVTFYEKREVPLSDYVTKDWLKKNNNHLSGTSFVLEPHYEEIGEYKGTLAIVWCAAALLFYFIGLIASQYNVKEKALT